MDDNSNNERSYFVEEKEYYKIINDLKTSDVCEDLVSSYYIITKILKKYQQTPQLLDKHLKGIITDLNESILSKGIGFGNKCYLFKVIYYYCKMRGYRTIVKLFKNDVELFRVIWNEIYLKEYKRLCWEAKYVIYLWVGLILLNPFKLEVILDKSIPYNKQIENIIEMLKKQMNISSKDSEAASLLLSRLLIRNDVMENNLSKFLEWVSVNLKESNIFVKINILISICNILKFGDRVKLLKYKEIFFGIVEKIDFNKSRNMLLKKYFVKLTQRLALLFLKPNNNWKYVKKTKKLFDNVDNVNVNDTNQKEKVQISKDALKLIPSFLRIIMMGLSDKDTIVRWSAAKGVGRIIYRLPKKLGNQIINRLLKTSFTTDNEHSWHGGCLALAELARRGLLLPDTLDNIIRVVIKALEFDEMKGSCSIGSNVRDSACYVCWAFARSYSPEILKRIMNNVLYPILLTMALFDREINCRRAASAAFQENVGRQGIITNVNADQNDIKEREKFIDLIDKVNYFSLSNRKRTYLEISYEICSKYKEYFEPFVNHLVKYKVGYWDRNLREVTSLALNKLSTINKGYVVKFIIPKLIRNTLSKDLNLRHGSLLSISRLIHLFKDQKNDDIDMIIPHIEKNKLYRGRGAEIMREAFCIFIKNMSENNIRIKSIESYQKIIYENLKHPKEEIIDATVESFISFSKNYYDIDDFQEIIDHLINSLNNSNIIQSTRRGYVLALGSIPEKLIKNIDVFNSIKDVMFKNISLKHDAESNRNAIIGLTRLCKNYFHFLNEDNVENIIEYFLIGINNYSIDRRGDVGSWVRKASMQGLEILLNCFNENKRINEIKKGTITTIISSIIKQAVEKIDNIREYSISVLYNIEKFLQNDHLSEILKHDEDVEKKITFPILIKALGYDEFRNYLIEGISISIGGLSANKNCKETLLNYLKMNNIENRNIIRKSVIDILILRKKNNRMIVPLLSFILLIITEYDEELEPGFCNSILDRIEYEIKGTKNIYKLKKSISICCVLIKCEKLIRKRSFTILLKYFFNNKSPKIRSHAANELHTSLNVYEDEFIDEIDDDEMDEIFTNLEKNWLFDHKEILIELKCIFNRTLYKNDIII